MTKTADVIATNNGSVWSFLPISKEAQTWFDENVQSEGWQYLGRSLVVDHRFAGPLIDGLLGAGFTVH